MKKETVHSIFAVCSPGLERLLESELQAVFNDTAVASTIKKSEGGVEFRGTLNDVQRANLWLRTANRILVRVGSFIAGRFDVFQQKFKLVPWERYLKPDQPVQFRVSSILSQLYHTDAIAERAKEAAEQRIGVPLTVYHSGQHNQAPQVVVIRFIKDRCWVSIDSSGEHLHRRGYKLATGKAPLRENFAAAMLLACGWQGDQPLLDPFCGSGTIPIEAALLAANIAPGLNRSFAFQNWEQYDHDHWETLLEEAKAAQKPVDVPIVGADRDQGVITAAAENAERAGVADLVKFYCRSISDNQPESEQPGWIITNPPYGTRIRHNRDLRNLYATFGKVCRNNFPGWGVGFLCTDLALVHQTELPVQPGISFSNGGIAVMMFITDDSEFED